VLARLAEAQPILAAVAVDPSLPGLLDELHAAVERAATDGDAPAGFEQIAEHVAEAARLLGDESAPPLSWSEALLDPRGRVHRLILIQGNQDFGETMPAERLIEAVQVEAERLGLTADAGVQVRLTGLVPLHHEELISILDDVRVASVIATVMLVAILGVGLRSLRVIVATLCALLLSLAATGAWAMASVGEFNTISAAFSVLLIGLGVDFGIHIGLRHEEGLAKGLDVGEALDEAVADTAAPVSLCALTSAIGFASFIPTGFLGLAALGVIASGGMGVSLLASYTVLPAVLSLTASRRSRVGRTGRLWGRLYHVLERRAGLVVGVTAVLAAGAIPLAVTGAAFDFDTLSLKDPESPSLTAMEELAAEEIVTDYSVTVTAPSLAKAERLAERLEAHPLVATVETPADAVPPRQADKLAALEQATYFLEPVLYPPPPEARPTPAERVEAVRRLVEAIRALPADIDPADRAAAEELARALEPVLDAPDPAARASALEERVIGDLPDRLAWLRRAVEVERVTFVDLPAESRARIVADDGRALIAVFPENDTTDIVALQRFVAAVKEVAPHATGRPVVEAGLGELVVESFRLALVITVIAVGAILLVTLRSLADALTVLAPISLAAFFTTAVGVLTGVHFNMVNVVAVPLVLGLGVDSGIHVFLRYRQDGSLARAIESTTPRAVMLSGLTTLGAFCSLAISSHRGLASLGVLLSVSIVLLLYCTLIVLPALVVLRDRLVRG